MQKPLLVFKVGTSRLTRPDGRINEAAMREWARQLAQLHTHYRMVIVSSGAVGSGKSYLLQYNGSLGERKAAAAIGNPLLMSRYFEAFRPYDIPIAQSLCERRHFSDRHAFLQLKNTYETLWENGVIPIANENDVVSDLELKFSDNDELATLIAVGLGADVLLFGTSVGGVLNGKGEVVREIKTFDEQVLALATTEKSDVGLGGMTSKLTFARLATSLGVRTVIFDAEADQSIIEALKGNIGTVCFPKSVTASARQKWLASGSLVCGCVRVDKGAFEALQHRKSLLAVGIEKVLQSFEKGEMFEMVVGNSKIPFAIGRAKLSAATLSAHLREKNLEVANADEIVLL